MIGEQLQTIKSAMDWWADAGLVDAVADRPFDWLAPVERAMPVTSVAIERSLPVTAMTVRKDEPKDFVLPGTLAAFDAWLAASPDLPGRDWSMRPVLPAGPAAAALMLIADVPDPADIEAGRLFSGGQGRLLDAMVASIGLTRDTCRVASIAVTRPLGGRLDGANADKLVGIARHHIALVQPKVLLLLGQQSAQLIAGEAISPTPCQHSLNHDGVKTAAFAIHHPRLLLERPLLKRPAWEVLKRVREQF